MDLHTGEPAKAGTPNSLESVAFFVCALADHFDGERDGIDLVIVGGVGEATGLIEKFVDHTGRERVSLFLLRRDSPKRELV